MEGSNAYESAKKRVEAKVGFYTHLSVYVAVILLLVAINLLTSPSVLWVQWPMMGWGIAVVLHGLAVFVFPNRYTITEQMIENEMNNDRRTH